MWYLFIRVLFVQLAVLLISDLWKWYKEAFADTEEEFGDAVFAWGEGYLGD